MLLNEKQYEVSAKAFTSEGKLFLGIIGSRNRDKPEDYRLVEEAYLDVFCRDKYECVPIVIVSGGAYKGGDEFAVRIARRNGHEMRIFFPNLSDVPAGIEGQGLAEKAYFGRNEQIARLCDILIACPHKGDHSGTKHTMFRFKVLHPDREIIEV